MSDNGVKTMKYAKTDEAVRKLTPDQYRVTQESGTERASARRRRSPRPITGCAHGQAE
jgi:peptide methionine sulfoxide reductase MsrB